jgi:hypothetical protein
MGHFSSVSRDGKCFEQKLCEERWTQHMSHTLFLSPPRGVQPNYARLNASECLTPAYISELVYSARDSRLFESLLFAWLRYVSYAESLMTFQVHWSIYWLQIKSFTVLLHLNSRNIKSANAKNCWHSVHFKPILYPVKQYFFTPAFDRLCGLVVRVPGYKRRGPGFDYRRYQIFCIAVGLEWGLLSLMRMRSYLQET